jgi:tetratricopeptide (TPR) repeat protein
MGLLYAAALEAAGIPAALVPLESEQGSGDFVIACYRGVTQAGAALLFNGLDRVLVIDEEVWLPLSMNAFNDGFMAAWDGGVEALNTVFAEGGEAEFIMLENVWGIYPPAPLPVQSGTAVRAGGGELAGIVDAVMRQYVNREIRPQVQTIQQQIRTGPSPALYNRLGILLVRSGQTTDAKAAYEQAAGLGSVPAMTNRGNLALIEKDYASAERWFRQALAREPANEAALQGLEKVGERGE